MLVAWPRVAAEEVGRSNRIRVTFLPAKRYCLIHRVKKGKGKCREITPVDPICPV